MQSSFPVIHKVRNVGIFVQLLIEIYWKQLRVEYASMQIYICHSNSVIGGANPPGGTNLLFDIIFVENWMEIRQSKNVNIANFVYYVKTR